jgi:hypothetical protein
VFYQIDTGMIPTMVLASDQSYETFYGRNLLINVRNKLVFEAGQAFPAWSNVCGKDLTRKYYTGGMYYKTLQTGNVWILL